MLVIGLFKHYKHSNLSLGKCSFFVSLHVCKYSLLLLQPGCITARNFFFTKAFSLSRPRTHHSTEREVLLFLLLLKVAQLFTFVLDLDKPWMERKGNIWLYVHRNTMDGIFPSLYHCPSVMLFMVTRKLGGRSLMCGRETPTPSFILGMNYQTQSEKIR